MAAPEFRAFNPQRDVRIYVRHLPHWRQKGATYFVTFRQDDSIPGRVLSKWQDVRKRWCRAHGLDDPELASDPAQWTAAYRRVPVAVRRAFERQQARMLHEELDQCHGTCVLRHAEAREILADSLSFFHGERLWVGDFVIMPNHAHVLITPIDGWELENLLESIKTWSSRKIHEWCRDANADRLPSVAEPAQGAFWQHEAYDRIVRDRVELLRFRRYIARNPQQAKLEPREYTYCPAEWLDKYGELSP